RRRRAGLLLGRRRVPVPVRARGLLRAAARGDGLRPARHRLRRGGGGGDAAGRGDPPSRETAGGGGGAARPRARGRRLARGGAAHARAGPGRGARHRLFRAPAGAVGAGAGGAGARSLRIDQWVPALHRGDASGDSARLMRDAFRAWGHEADVYALDLDEDLQGDGRPYAQWRAGDPADVVILHYALPSPLSAALEAHRGRRVLLHHNITPPEFFVGHDPELARICAIGQEEFRRLAPHVDLGLADSEFNRRELEEAGFARTGVLPNLLDLARYREPPNPVLRRMLDDGRT